jgi:trimethylamine--corrinoid protein Co-methyltransferase
MKTSIQVLSEKERVRIHETSLDILENTGVRVETAQGRRILKEAGARVDDTSKIVRFPQRMIEESLKSVPKEFALGARRSGADLKMNGGDCTLCLDGCGTMTLDHQTGERRRATYADCFVVAGHYCGPRHA